MTSDDPSRRRTAPSRATIVASVLLFLFLPVLSAGPSAEENPVAGTSREIAGVAADDVLLERTDPGLQAAVREALNRLGLAPQVEAGRLGLAVVDLGRPDRIRYAAVNGDRMFYAASLPKIAVLLGWFAAVERGDVTPTAGLERAVVRMIRYSDNGATNLVLRAVGFASVARTLQDRRYRLYDPDLGGGLWVGKAYGEDRYWSRDPLARLSHGATPRQVARYFVLLDRGGLVSPSASRAMKAILGDPGIVHKFVRALGSRPGTRIFRKSGTWREYHADAALVERPGARYVLVGLVRDRGGERILQRLAGAVDELMGPGPGREAAPRRRASETLR